MNTQAYRYGVIKYVHDPAVGECLNIGVFLSTDDGSFIDAKFDHNYGRLSKAFAHFDSDHYRRYVARLRLAVQRLADRASEPALFERRGTLEDFLGELVPDSGLSFQIGALLAGVTSDPAAEVEHVFVRFVTSQYEREESVIRSDESVWNIFRHELRRQDILNRLQPKTFSADELKYSFDHSFKNGRWHILESASFDYVQSDSLRRRATQYLGIGTALSKNPEVGKLYLLLGRPSRPAYLKQYESAKRLLADNLQIDHALVEEEEAGQFAEEVAQFMKSHPSR